jgi:crotonobetainyl-CoA:carnitine CoA-transferase CaiB-like acyl-CoA transferase
MQLTELRVLDLSRVLSGPYCTMLLGDMGAEVEVPGEGDLTRGIADPESEARGGPPVFFDLNRNKKSLTLNLKAMVLEQHYPAGRHRQWLGFPLRLTARRW